MYFYIVYYVYALSIQYFIILAGASPLSSLYSIYATNRDGILSRVLHLMSVFLESPLFSHYAQLIKPTMQIFA